MNYVIVLYMISVVGSPAHATLERIIPFYTQSACKVIGEALMDNRNSHWVGYACVKEKDNG